MSMIKPTKPQKFYEVCYESKGFATLKPRGPISAFGVKSTHSTLAIADTHRFKHNRHTFKKPFAREITEEQFFNFPSVAADTANVRW